MRGKTFPFDAADCLDSDEAVGAYLADVLCEDAHVPLSDALQTAIRACGIGGIV